MNSIKRIAVFCGSYKGIKKEYREAAHQLALELSKANIGLVYGGAKVGLMGQLADEMLANGKEVIGVIPKLLVDIEIAHHGVSQLHVVDSMHARKALMADLADAFIMLPGGVGSLEEFFEILTWNKLGILNKPCGILNTHRFFNPLIKLLDHIVEENFLKPIYRNRIIIENSPQKLLTALRNYQLPATKWEHEESQHTDTVSK